MGDVEFSRQMMSMFCTEVMQSRPALLEAVKTKNCKTILRTCHKLKGSSKMLGAIRMQFSLNNWEEATKPAFKNQITFSTGDATKLFEVRLFLNVPLTFHASPPHHFTTHCGLTRSPVEKTIVLDPGCLSEPPQPDGVV